MEWLSKVFIAYCKMNGWLPYAGKKYVRASVGLTGAQYNKYYPLLDVEGNIVWSGYANLQLGRNICR